MEFTLNYRGRLRANGNPKHKHEIRKVFHRQLSELWKLPPFIEKDKIYIKREQRSYLPTICERWHLIAKIDLTLLRPEPPGRIITQAGDIDNRLKTLFDSLQIPTPEQASEHDAEEDEGPLICLLEDDNLISRINVETYQLLEEDVNPSEVLLIIKVKIGISKSIIDNIDFV